MKTKLLDSKAWIDVNSTVILCPYCNAKLAVVQGAWSKCPICKRHFTIMIKVSVMECVEDRPNAAP